MRFRVNRSNGSTTAVNIPARFVTGIAFGASPEPVPINFHAHVAVCLGQRG